MVTGECSKPPAFIYKMGQISTKGGEETKEGWRGTGHCIDVCGTLLRTAPLLPLTPSTAHMMDVMDGTVAEALGPSDYRREGRVELRGRGPTATQASRKAPRSAAHQKVRKCRSNSHSPFHSPSCSRPNRAGKLSGSGAS
jgi:hypothetical protein